MAALGTLDAIHPADQFSSDSSIPVRPGDSAPALLASSSKSRSSIAKASVIEATRSGAEESRERVLRMVGRQRTSTTLAALAQAHAALGETQDAIRVAREALRLGVGHSSGSARLLDPASARIAAEVLLSLGDNEHVFEVLGAVDRSKSLTLTYALVASALDKPEVAMAALEDQNGPLVESVRGYLLASEGQHQRAIHHLREALNDEPKDVDALLNLSISLWSLGSTRKATRAALRATRTAPGRKDISLHYMELLLAQGEIDRLAAEIAVLKSMNVVPDAHFLVVQARVFIAKGEKPKAVSVFEKAAKEAKREGDDLTTGMILGNLVLLRYELERLNREQASKQLEALMGEFPDSDALAVNFAQIASTSGQAFTLRQALSRLGNRMTPIHQAYVRHQLALLDGDNAAAGIAAEEWFEL